MDTIGQLTAIAAVLGLLGATSWWLRKKGGRVALGHRGGRRLQSMERLPLGPQQTLHLVRFGERALLVAASPAGCVLLDSTAWKEVLNSPEVAP